MHSNKRARISDNITNDIEISEPNNLSPGTKSVCFPYREVNITDLPREVLSQVFQYCSYEIIAVQLRTVCREFCNVSTMVLNSGFATLGPKIERAMVVTELGMRMVSCEHEMLIMSRCFNALEVLKYEYLLLRAVTWRYVCNQFTGTEPLACFYAGLILDNFLKILNLSVKSPSNLSWNFQNHNPETSVIGKLCEEAKKFMNHFEKVTEKKINVHYSISGAKIVDLLDCLVESDNQVERYKYTENISDKGCCYIKTCYRMERSWFTCLYVGLQDGEERSWREEQKFMYLRLRRLVASNNEHMLEQMHQERENLLRIAAVSPLSSTYSGYGEYGGMFFYYGSMNLSAFLANNYQHEGSDDSSDDEHNVPSFSKLEPLCSDLDFYIEIECPLYLAPIKYIEKYEKPDPEYRYNIMSMNDSEPTFKLTMDVYCPLSLENRLPFMFKWVVSSHESDQLNVSFFKRDNYCSIPTENLENTDS